MSVRPSVRPFISDISLEHLNVVKRGFRNCASNLYFGVEFDNGIDRTSPNQWVLSATQFHLNFHVGSHFNGNFIVREWSCTRQSVYFLNPRAHTYLTIPLVGFLETWTVATFSVTGIFLWEFPKMLGKQLGNFWCKPHSKILTPLCARSRRPRDFFDFKLLPLRRGRSRDGLLPPLVSEKSALQSLWTLSNSNFFLS